MFLLKVALESSVWLSLNTSNNAVNTSIEYADRFIKSNPESILNSHEILSVFLLLTKQASIAFYLLVLLTLVVKVLFKK